MTTSDARGAEGVISAGTTLVDVAKSIDVYPEIDHVAVIDDVSLSTGGPGFNLAVDLRHLGATFPIGVLGAVGADANGEYILAECARLGLDATGLQTLAGATSFTDVMVERHGGRRTFFHHSGVNTLLDLSSADLGLVGSAGAKILHVGAPGLSPFMDQPLPDGGNRWVTLLTRAQAAGMHTNLELVSLDPARLREVALPCLPHLDSIIVNEIEAGALTGIDASAPAADVAQGSLDWEAMESIARGLLDLGVARLAVVHFPAGCVAATADGGLHRQGSVRVPSADVRSTTGAGDAFAAGVILGVHEGWPVEQSLRLAVAAAAACITDTHTSNGLRTASECLADADRHGYRATGLRSAPTR